MVSHCNVRCNAMLAQAAEDLLVQLIEIVQAWLMVEAMITFLGHCLLKLEDMVSLAI
jgi:hypothetical protein